ncbi:hypothetical protein ACWD7M_16635 [Streptomyces griseus]
MSYQVVLKAGLANVVLPNGNLYQGGDEAILTDEQYGRMTDSARAAVIESAAVVPVPGT